MGKKGSAVKLVFKTGDPPWLWNLGQMSPEEQKLAPQKDPCLSFCFKKLFQRTFPRLSERGSRWKGTWCSSKSTASTRCGRWSSLASICPITRLDSELSWWRLDSMQRRQSEPGATKYNANMSIIFQKLVAKYKGIFVWNLYLCFVEETYSWRGYSRGAPSTTAGVPPGAPPAWYRGPFLMCCLK